MTQVVKDYPNLCYLTQNLWGIWENRVSAHKSENDRPAGEGNRPQDRSAVEGER